MNIKCLGSSSSGNMYVIETEGFSFAIECGIKWKEALKRSASYGVNLSNIKICLITHGHKDHCVAINDIIDHGWTPVCSEETVAACNVDESKCIIIRSGQRIDLGKISITAFNVVHDFENSLGFYVENIGDKKESLIFINDSSRVDFDLSWCKPTIAMVECNYIDKFIWIEYTNAKKAGNLFDIKRYERIIRYHMGLSGTRKILENISSENLKCVILMHLSDQNANEYEMKEDISKFMQNGRAHPCIVAVAQKEGGIK